MASLYSAAVRVVAAHSFSRWYSALNLAAKDAKLSPAAREVAVLRRDRINALLQTLARLEQIPTIDHPPLLKRIRQRTRYDLWRLGHPYHPKVAVRMVVHFRSNPDEVVVALVGGDKLGISDQWYDAAVVQAEAALDQYYRQHPAPTITHDPRNTP
jgi:hypothetical protein